MQCLSCGADGYETTTMEQAAPSFIGACGHQWLDGWDPWLCTPAPVMGAAQDVALPTAEEFMAHAFMGTLL
jgi:hypothetical protein